MPAPRLKLLRPLLGLAALLVPSVASAQIVKGDPVKGQRETFTRCLNCHSVNVSGQHGSAPNLFGIIGRPAGKAPGYYYSVPLGRVDFEWSEVLLLAFLRNPSRMIPGNAMNFQGVDDPARSDIISYLYTLKKPN